MLQKIKRIVLKKGREFAIRRYHPWIFSGAVQDANGVEEGDIVEIYSNENQFLAVGFWNAAGISVKILSFKKREIDCQYWIDSFATCKKLREDLGLFKNESTDAFRFCNAEGDGTPGLVIDLYGTTAVVQFHARVHMQNAEDIYLALKSTLPGLKAIVCKLPEALAGAAPSINNFKSGAVWGNIENSVMLENGMKFLVDFEKGQKTGFFLDQRDNRKILMDLSAKKDVLNAFCYTGGFSIAALRGGASTVTSVDSSQAATNLLEENLKLNPTAAQHDTITDDFFDYLSKCEKTFDIIVLDPPAFSKHRESVDAAIKGYATLNQQALLRLRPRGLLFTFSCSQLVGRDRFREAVAEGAYRAGRQLKILKELHASPCHPVSLFHPEGEYLKGFLLKVN